MRVYESFTFYPSEWYGMNISGGLLGVTLDVDAIWNNLDLPGEPGCLLVTAAEYDDAFDRADRLADANCDLEDKIGELESKIKELEKDLAETDKALTRAENLIEELAEKVAK